MGLSDYPYNFQNLFEGCSVSQSERYPSNYFIVMRTKKRI